MVRAMSQDAWSNTIAERNHILCESSSYCVCCNVGVFIIYVPVTSGLSIEEVARVSVFRGRYDRHARDTRKICTVAHAVHADLAVGCQVERDRGITVKAQTASMIHDGHLLNLIDTPGHVDFSYEVSTARAPFLLVPLYCCSDAAQKMGPRRETGARL